MKIFRRLLPVAALAACFSISGCGSAEEPETPGGESSNRPEKVAKDLPVFVEADGTVVVDGKAADGKSFRAAIRKGLQKHGDEFTVRLFADATVRHGAVRPVLDVCTEEGINLILADSRGVKGRLVRVSSPDGEPIRHAWAIDPAPFGKAVYGSWRMPAAAAANEFGTEKIDAGRPDDGEIEWLEFVRPGPDDGWSAFVEEEPPEEPPEPEFPEPLGGDFTGGAPCVFLPAEGGAEASAEAVRIPGSVHASLFERNENRTFPVEASATSRHHVHVPAPDVSPLTEPTTVDIGKPLQGTPYFFAFNKKRCTEEMLAGYFRQVARTDRDLPIVCNVTKDAPDGVVLRALEQAKQEGLHGIAVFSLDNPEPRPGWPVPKF